MLTFEASLRAQRHAASYGADCRHHFGESSAPRRPAIESKAATDDGVPARVWDDALKAYVQTKDPVPNRPFAADREGVRMWDDKEGDYVYRYPEDVPAPGK